MNDQPVLDFTGVEIHSGDAIVYPYRRGSRLVMHNATVLAVIKSDLAPQLLVKTKSGRETYLTRIDNVVVL